MDAPAPPHAARVARAARPVVVVLGAGFAGLSTVRRLRGDAFDVVVVDATNHHLFQPLLYQVATASLSPADVAIPIRTVFRRRSNVRVLWGTVSDVDLDRRRVLLEDGAEVRYDVLVVALGARNHWYGHPEWEAHAVGLKDLADAVRLRARLLSAFERAERIASPADRAPWLTFVVVGGGPTGVEMAGAIADIARRTLRGEFRAFESRIARVLLLEGGDRVLSAFAPDLSAAAHAALVAQGVEIRTRAHVTAIDAEGVRLGEERIAAQTVVWAAGVRAVPLLERLGAPLHPDGRVLVAPDLTLPGRPEVFVIGDAAAVRRGGAYVPAIAPPAIQMGRYVADALDRRRRGRPVRPFRYRDRGTLAAIGRRFAVAEFPRLHLSGTVGWLVWALVHVAFLIGFRNRVAVLLEWAWAYATDRRSARLLFPGDPPPLGGHEGLSGPSGAPPPG